MKAETRSLLFRITLVCSSCWLSVAQATYITGTENVNGTRKTPAYTHDGTSYGPYEWNFSYTRSYDGTKLSKNVEIDFKFDADTGFDDAKKKAYKAAVEQNIENIWNNKFQLVDTNTGTMIPILVDVTTTGPFNQTVQVHKGSGRADMLNWYLDDAAAINAHEFGHMLGLFDEYIGGAVDKYPNPTLSNDGLMGLGALLARPAMYSRYFQQYLDYMNTLNPDSEFDLRRVAEPDVLVLFLIGLFLTAAVRRTRVQQSYMAY